MDMGGLRGAITIVTMAAFFGVCWWAYRSPNRGRFERDAMLPFLDEEGAMKEQMKEQEKDQ